MARRTTAAVVIVALAAGVALGIALSRRDQQRKGLPLLVAEPMSACGRAVLADFSDNSRIDRLYSLHCYREALGALPSDLRKYAKAPIVIRRALFYARDHRVVRTPVTVAVLRAGKTVALTAPRVQPGDWITCVKQGNRVRARVQPRGHGVGLSADGLTYSTTLDITTSAGGRVVASCR